MKRTFYVLVFITLLVKSAIAQELPELQNNFNTMVASSPQEKVFIHTDKNAYTAGELLWLKAYDVDGIYLKPLAISKVLYVELIDADKNPVLQAKIAMSSGAGNGALSLPLKLSTGNYTLRAYTSWMKNFSPDFYFSKLISIINPLKSPEETKKNILSDADVQFFPEGGSLVNNLTSVVGVKISDQYGNGQQFKGAIIDPKNDTLVRFASLKYGMGKFAFKPEDGKSYQAVISFNGRWIRKEMPAAKKQGYVLALKDDGSEKLKVTVSANAETGTVYLFAQSKSVIKLVEKAEMSNGIAGFNLDKGRLGDGVTQITIFDKEKRPVCERLYFKRPAKNLVIGAAPDSSYYTTRRKVELKIDARSEINSPVSADLSLSVYKLDSLQFPDEENIQSYFWLSYYLKGKIESAAYYFQNTDATANEALDNLMLTQGWSTFNWNDVSSGKRPSFAFVPELVGPIVTAKITERQSGKAAAGINAFLGIPGKSVQLYAAKSDQYGKLLFNMKNFYGPAEVVAETNTEIDSTFRIEILSPFSEQFSQEKLPRLDITESLKTAFEEQNVATQVQETYSGTKMKQFADPHADSTAFYGHPYRSYIIENYTHFTTTEEVLREYVKEVNITHVRNQFHIKVLNGLNYISDHDPMVLVDGIPFFNINKVFAVDPQKIRKLDDVPYSYYLGSTQQDGIFSFTSYKGDFGGVEIDPHAVIVDYEGLQKERIFYSPAYATAQDLASPVPDLRNVLYWSPSVTTGADGKKAVSFYTSDEAGYYIGVVQGVTASGEMGYKTFNFIVKPDFEAQIKN